MLLNEALLTPGHKTIPKGGVTLSTIVVPVRPHLLSLLAGGSSTLRSSQGWLDGRQALGSVPPIWRQRIRPGSMTNVH